MRPSQLDVLLQKLLGKGLPGNQKTTRQESKLVSISEPITLSEFSRMRYVPRPKAPMLLQSIVPPGKYSDQVAEREFLQEFRTVGLQFTVYAFILGCLLTITGYVLIAARLVNVPINDTQFVRVLILAFLSLSICVFLWASEFTLRHYKLVVGIPLSFAGLSLGYMAILYGWSHPEYSHRLLTALVIAIWLICGFTRLPVVLAGGISVLASAALYLSAVVMKVSDQHAVLMYVVVANMVGWVSCVQIERRERRLFSQSRELKELQKRVQSQLAQVIESTREKDRILNGVVHDLRQPLASLDLYFVQFRNYADELGRDQRLSQLERMESCLNFIRTGVDRLLLRPGENERDLGTVCLSDLIAKVIRIFEGPSSREGVFLKNVSRRGRVINVRSNEAALAMILSNVVDNAIKFCSLASRKDRTVLISVVRIRDLVRLDIIDNGVGLDPEEVQHVFEQNWRGRMAKAAAVEGSGVGLASVKYLCGQLPGHNVALTATASRGARVRLWIPAAELP